jgi:hypothetical protein
VAGPTFRLGRAMRRPALAGLSRLAVVTASVLWLVGCGSATSAQPGAGASSTSTASSSIQSRLTVSPSTGAPTTTFTLHFNAPASSGKLGHTQLGYTVSLSGPAGAGCLSARSVGLPTALKDTPILVALDPAKLGGTWCAGTHTARAVELQTPICSPGTMCPDFIRVVGTVGTVTFRVLGSG